MRALSSCYVERREKLASGGPLDSAGKRAAFALFYAPVHFLITQHITQELDASAGVERVSDLGCGTGSAGAAFAIGAARPEGRAYEGGARAHEGGARVEGVDRNAWAVAEANWTYRTLGVQGRAATGTIQKTPLRAGAGSAVLAAYAVNELPDPDRDALLPRLLDAHGRGSRILIIEPIARRFNRWWDGWKDAFAAAGGRENEWRVRVVLPSRQRALAKAAGLDPQELTARSLYLQP
ncbi:MAG TPA: class I SAM-dependent methyltransferase [Vicinamibacterales bacterium]|nr:class I SAM-dependent methyltransferase [Vicinamibacterales bacterium]